MMHLPHSFFSSGDKFAVTFSALTTVLSVFVTFLVTLGLGFHAAEIAAVCSTSLLVIGMASMMTCLHFLTKNPRWLMCWIGKLAPASLPVMMMDFQGTIYYSLALEKDGEWVAPVYWGTNTGKVLLKPNGICDHGDCSYVYLWEPLRQSDRAHFFLMNIDQPNASEFARWTNRERIAWVDQKRKETL